MMEKSKILLIFRLRPNFLFQIVQENWCLQSDRLSVLSLSPFRSKLDLNSVTMLTTLVGAHIRLHISTMVHPKNKFFNFYNSRQGALLQYFHIHRNENLKITKPKLLQQFEILFTLTVETSMPSKFQDFFECCIFVFSDVFAPTKSKNKFL